MLVRFYGYLLIYLDFPLVNCEFDSSPMTHYRCGVRDLKQCVTR